jgi:hypothetical protein
MQDEVSWESTALCCQSEGSASICANLCMHTRAGAELVLLRPRPAAFKRDSDEINAL